MRKVLGAGRGLHMRLMSLGIGYRYAGRGVWFDGVRQKRDAEFRDPQRGAVHGREAVAPRTGRRLLRRRKLQPNRFQAARLALHVSIAAVEQS